jgi:hypothetical protein
MNGEMSPARLIAGARYDPARAGLWSLPPYLSGEGPRALAHRLAFAYLDWSLPASPRRGSEEEVRRMNSLSSALLSLQRGNGTVDSDNLASPPDTAFVVETIEALLAIASRDPEAGKVPAALGRAAEFCDRAEAMLATAGVHTPNHRWVLCAALARGYARTGKAEYREACLDWLGEGIDIDAEGQFSERSSGIYTPVTCVSLIVMARSLGLPELLEPVRKALATTLSLIQPGGEVETIASRRQDQAQTAYLSRQAFPFAYMAALDGDPRFAWAARLALARPEEAIEQLHLFLAYAPGEPGGDWRLPAEEQAEEDYTVFLEGSGLVRRRTGKLALSVYGGSDLARGPSLPEASGIAGNPSILTFRKGKAALRWLRIRPLCFDLPSARFRLEGFDGKEARLSWERTVPYYGRLPREKRKPDGDYVLSTGDGRFWSKLSFGDRPWLNECRLSAGLSVRLLPEGCAIEAELGSNLAAPALLELAFDAESSVAPLPAGGIRVSCGTDAFCVYAEGPGSWRETTAEPTGEHGRHAGLGDGEGRPKALLRWAYEAEAPCRISLVLKAE